MLDTLLTFLNENQLIAAFLTVSGLASPVFGGVAALFRKKSNLNEDALNAIKHVNQKLDIKLTAAESQLKLYDPNLIVAQLNQLKAEGAPEAELQKAAEKYFGFQNQAITAAAKHLAECALQNEHEDGKAALHEAKRWLSLGLSASPQNSDLVVRLKKVNTRLNAANLHIPEELLEIDPSLNFEQISNITSDLIDKAQFTLAEVYAKRGIVVARQEYGELHANYSAALNNLAQLLSAIGRYEEAEPLYRQALEITRTALGEKHPDFGMRLNNFAGLLNATGRFVDAELLYRQALEIARLALGEDHPDFGMHLNNLATVLRDTGRFAEAEPLYRQALEIARAALGEDHPDFGTRLNNLAALLEATGCIDEAEPLFRQALENTRAVLGGDHPTYGTNLNNLAKMLQESGRFGEAEPLYRQAVEVLENALGQDHPTTQTVKANFEQFLAARPPDD